MRQGPKKDDKIFLQHILDSIRYIESHTKNISKESFFRDIKTQDAVVRRVEIIGEAVKNLSDGLKYRHIYIDWGDIAGTRDIVVHEYFDVNLDIIWDTVKNNIPSLKKEIQEILSETE